MSWLQSRPPPASPKVSIEAKRSRGVIVTDISQKIISHKDEGGVSRGVEALIASSSLIHPWLTRNMILGHLRKMKENERKLMQTSIEKSTSANTALTAVQINL